MIPIDNFEAQSMTGKFVPIFLGAKNVHLTYHNRKEYVEKALLFRLKELDKQVCCVLSALQYSYFLAAAVSSKLLLFWYTRPLLTGCSGEGGAGCFGPCASAFTLLCQQAGENGLWV